MNKLLIVICVAIYCLSPIDFVPDVLFPVGFADDIAAIGFAVNKLCAKPKDKDGDAVDAA